MKTVFPDYYEDFECIADKCKHSCCIGWEIDIDPESLEFYQSVQGDFGKKLRDNISLCGTPHFILSENERCPFLNSCNLCEIYINSGKDKLCHICSEHPRFYNAFEDFTEAGLGLCCEEAARLIITKEEPMKLLNEDKNPQGIFLLRKKIFEFLQDRSLPLPSRIQNANTLLGVKPFDVDIPKWVKVFERLERLSADWSTLLDLLKTNPCAKPFDKDENQYEQFLCYLIYRHCLKSDFLEDFTLYYCFALLSLELVKAMEAAILAHKGEFATEDRLEIMRLFSSEIEYSDENLDIILEEIENM